MKSSGLFPHRASYRRGNQAGGSAGNSSGSGKPGQGGDGYKTGMLGDRAGRSAGGVSGANRQAGRPVYDDKSLRK